MKKGFQLAHGIDVLIPVIGNYPPTVRVTFNIDLEEEGNEEEILNQAVKTLPFLADWVRELTADKILKGYYEEA